MSDYTEAQNLEAMQAAVRYNRFLLGEILKFARPGQEILDIGAGIGTFALELSRAGLRVRCVEPDEPQRQRLLSEGLDAASGTDGVADASMDFIYSLNVLEHIENDEEAIARWCRKLKPGGTLLLYVPAFDLLFSSMDRRVGHFRRYTRGGLEPLVARRGLRIEQSRYVDCLGFWAAAVYKVVVNADGGLSERFVGLYDRFVFPVSRVLDVFFQRLFGKNLLVVAKKPPR